MNVVITGHTSGLGKALHDHFVDQGHVVIGLSRSNGYDVWDQFNEICDIAANADLFINNVYSNDVQSKFIEQLYHQVSMITIGSIGADFYLLGNDYRRHKKFVEETHRVYRKQTHLPMLLLKPGYLENYPDNYPITYKQITDLIDFWLIDPSRISLVELENHQRIYKG